MHSVTEAATTTNYHKMWAEWFILQKASAFAKPGHYTFFSESVYLLQENKVSEGLTCRTDPCSGTAWTHLWEFYRYPRMGMISAVERTHRRSRVRSMVCYPNYIREHMEEVNANKAEL